MSPRYKAVKISVLSSKSIFSIDTGPSDPPMLTPSVCSYSLLLQEKTVFVHVSRMSLRSVDFLSFVLTSFLL